MSQEKKKRYRLTRGTHRARQHDGTQKQYEIGDELELTQRQAHALRDRVDRVGVSRAPEVKRASGGGAKA